VLTLNRNTLLTFTGISTHYTGQYNNIFTYDANGNIEHQLRNDDQGNMIDSLHYHYYETAGRKLQNRLYAVHDLVKETSFTDDIDDQGTIVIPALSTGANNVNTANNYGYDEIGNLTRDNQEGIANIKWTVYGKIQKIIRVSSSTKADLEFKYDVNGNRIAKIVKPHGSSVENGGMNNSNLWKTTYYTRDAQGNTMAVYKKAAPGTTTSFLLQERNIYGNSRLGMETMNAEMIGAVASIDTLNRYLGMKHYEVSNHLGNVLAVFSDKKIPIASTNNTGMIGHFEVDLLNSTDYSAFGVELQGRRFVRPIDNVITITLDRMLKAATGSDPNEYLDVKIGNSVLHLCIFNGTYSNINAYVNDIKNSLIAAGYTPTVNGNSISFGTPTVSNNEFSGGNFLTIKRPNQARYGFNGKEKDDDLYGEGESYDYIKRIFDPRTGRFLSIDPLRQKFPWYTPYQFAGNTPIQAIDIDGEEPKSVVRYDAKGDGHFTAPAVHLLSMMSGVSEKLIENSVVQKRGPGQYRPWYNANNGGGAITLGTLERPTITYTENWFDNSTKAYSGHGYGLDVQSWLVESSHEVGHLPQLQNSGGIFSYLGEFIKQYSQAGSHDEAPFEKAADVGANNLVKFNAFVDHYFGKESIQKLFNNSKMTDKQKIAKLDDWNNHYKTYQELKKDGKSTISISDILNKEQTNKSNKKMSYEKNKSVKK
jgi:RHS repeat-associated protein